uniref:Uncharacterized protein n=1 Tax=Leersia perrieri TaxID=77586 RepID=A0A0D9W205_9ORYZ
MPASDKQLTSSVKKVTSRELPNKGANIVNMSQGTSPLPKDKSHATDPGKAVGTKRSDAPASPGYHNVYVRRKVENDHSKVNSSQELKGNGRDKTKEQETQQNVQHDQINKPELASPIAESGVKMSPKSPDKTNEQIVTEKNEPHVASGSTAQDDTHKSSNQVPAQDNTHKSSNQTYLENCDRSTQEGYMRMLRSLSAADRSMHAIDLEKRAIHLLVEEGKELRRMKALNVLGKVSPNGSSKQPPL